MPVGPEELAQQPHHHAHRHLDRLAHRLGGADHHLLADDDHAGGFLDHQRQRAVEQHLIAHQHLQRIAQRGLVANQQPDWPEVRQLARLGHAQAEALEACRGRRGLEQAADALGRDLEIGLAQYARAQARIGEHANGVESGGAGHLAVIGQARGSDKWRHRGIEHKTGMKW